MKIFQKRFAWAVLSIVAAMPAARAQLSVYATVSGARFGGVTCPSFATPCAQTDGKVKPYGTNFGAFYDFRNVGPMRLGVDLRGGALLSNKRADSSFGGNSSVRHTSGLVGLRGSFKTRIPALTPYVEVAGGIDRNNDTGLYTNTTTVLNVAPPVTTRSLAYDPSRYTNYGLVQGLAGVEISLGSLISFRAIEFGFGEAFGSVTNTQFVTVQQNASGVVTSQMTTSQTSGPSTHSVVSISTGLVFHFGR